MNELQALLHLCLEATASQLQSMREALDKALADIAIEKQIREQLILAVNEACMNVIQHAYCGDHQGEIRLTLEHDGRRLRFLVEDDAPCIDPTCITPRDLTDIRPGGLGVHFIREIMDEVRFSPTGGQGNKLEMIKHLDTIGPN